MRAIMGETFIDFPVPDHRDLAETIARTREFLERWKGDPLIRPAVAPHAPDTCSKETLLAARKLAAEFHVPIEIHVSETRHEVVASLERWGRSPVAYLQGIGFFGISPTILAHVVWLEEGDVAILASPGIGVSHNPESNMKLASGIAPVARYEKENVAWSLGTDGPASNDDLSMFEAMDFAAKLSKVSTDDPTALPARAVVRAATIGGARVLGLDARIGSLETGKEADLILVDATAPHAVPGTDPEAMIVYSLKASDVTDVWVAGRRLLDRRRPLTLEGAAIVARARGWRRKIERSLAIEASSGRSAGAPQARFEPKE
jgi:5-methylthioadenosine/S-adenosylhomocysteine deaminase